MSLQLTAAQRDLLEDKFVLWERMGREYGNAEYRDYHRRAAEAMKVALAICSEAPAGSLAPAE